MTYWKYLPRREQKKELKIHRENPSDIERRITESSKNTVRKGDIRKDNYFTPEALYIG